MNTLIFRNTVLETVFHNGKIWFTSAMLAKALHYSSSKCRYQLKTDPLCQLKQVAPAEKS